MTDTSSTVFGYQNSAHDFNLSDKVIICFSLSFEGTGRSPCRSIKYLAVLFHIIQIIFHFELLPTVLQSREKRKKCKSDALTILQSKHLLIFILSCLYLAYKLFEEKHIYLGAYNILMDVILLSMKWSKDYLCFVRKISIWV